MTKEELIQKLLEYKAQLKNTYCDLDDVISDAMSDVCDYDNDNDFSLDSYTYYYETTDWIEEFIKATLKDWWILTLKNRLSEVDSDCEWYHVDDCKRLLRCRRMDRWYVVWIVIWWSWFRRSTFSW